MHAVSTNVHVHLYWLKSRVWKQNASGSKMTLYNVHPSGSIFTVYLIA